MARLRQENEQEELQLAVPLGEDGDHDENGHRKKQPTKEIIQVNEEELEGLDEDEQMKMLLGFSGSFASTSGQKVEDNHGTAAKGAAAKNKVRNKVILFCVYMSSSNCIRICLTSMHLFYAERLANIVNT